MDNGAYLLDRPCFGYWDRVRNLRMEGWKEIVFLILAFAPVLYEAWTDRKGEERKDKIVDTALLVGYSVLLTAGAYLVLADWVTVPLLIIMFRITCFDYIAHAFLKKYSKVHKEMNIWKFTGQTALSDRIVSKVPWALRLAIRVVLLVASVVVYGMGR